jgi:hypothetical protein
VCNSRRVDGVVFAVEEDWESCVCIRRRVGIFVSRRKRLGELGVH